MTTPIGYAPVQLIPVLGRGFSAEVDKQLGGLVVQGKAAGKKIGDGLSSGFSAGVRSGEADVKRALDGYSKLYDKAADQAGKLKVAQAGVNDLVEKGVTSGARYERAIAAQEKAQRDHNRVLREAKGAYGEYERAARDAARAVDKVADAGGGGGFLDKLKGAAGSARERGSESASGFVEGFEGPIAAIGTRGGPIGLALAAAAGVALLAGGAIANQVMAGMEQQQSTANAAAKLGLTPEQMRPIAAAAAGAYAANFGESVSANMDTARAAIQSGLLDQNASQADVQAIVQQLDTVSSVMGEEIPATARAASQAIRTGLAGNASEAFDLFTKAQQSGLNVSEDFLDTITEYGTQFRKLGLDGPEAIGLISQAVKGGARDTDVAADAIKEFSIRAVDGSATTADGFSKLGLSADEMAAKFAQGGPAAKAAFGEVLTAVRSISDPVQQAQVSVELFGTQSEDLGGALGRMDLSNAVTQLGEVDGAAQRAADTMGNTTASSVESARRAVELAAGGMQASLADAFGPTVQNAANWVIEHQAQITNGFQQAADLAGEFGAAMVGTGGIILQAWGNIAGAVGDGVGVLLDGMSKGAEAAGVLAGAMGMDGMSATLRTASTVIGGVAQDFYGMGEGTKAAGANLVGLAGDFHNFQADADASGNSVARIRDIMATLPDGKNIDITAIVTYRDVAGRVIPPEQLNAPVRGPAVPGETRRGPGRAFGGEISGPGGPKSDIIPIWASNGEHMWTADEVDAVGGQENMYRLRGLVRAGAFRGFADGGAIDNAESMAQSMDGLPYIYGARDCSKVQSDVYAALTGKPAGPRYFTTESDFEALGFVPGYQEGAYNIGVRRGGGGKLSHMAGTLPNGVNFEAGGADSTVKYGGNASGAEDFPLQWYLPVTGGDPSDGSYGASAGGFSGGLSGGAGGSMSGYEPGPAGSTPGVNEYGEAGYYTPDARSVREADQKIREADARVAEADARKRELDADAKESERISADNALAKAKQDAADARADAEEARKGKFTAAKAIDSSSSSSSSGSAGSSFSFPTAFSQLAGLGLAGMGISTKVSPNSPERTFAFGDALGSAVGGQVSSALGVFGVGDSPPWMQAASKLISGISIGGGDGASAAPLSSIPSAAGALIPPDNAGNMHGTRAGQAPGPVFNTTIQARDAEGALEGWQRLQNQRTAAKLDRF